jgi:glycosyltransferase involved in cell wall biosynthesis
MERPVTVSVVIPAAKAGPTLKTTIESVLAQDYEEHFDITVAAADDESADAARQAGATVVSNPSGTTSQGLNLAIAQSKGNVIVRVDAHATIPPDYVSKVVHLLQTTGAENVGGMQVPVGTTFWERAIAAAMGSAAGSGDASYRIGGHAGPTDTVYLGAFSRETFERLGGFDETFIRHQDYEFNRRIVLSGGVVWFDPSLQVEYRPRSNLRDLARQYFQYGTWKRRFSRKHRDSLKPRQYAPPVLTTGLVVALLGSILWPQLLLIPAAYGVVLLGIGLVKLPRAGLPALGTPLALAVMHISWGLGFLFGHTSDR